MPTIQLLAPALEPIHLAEAKAHLRVDTTDEDALIATLIPASRAPAEAYLRRPLVMGQYALALDHFPHPHYELGVYSWADFGGFGGNGFGPGPLLTQPPRGKNPYEIRLPFAGLVSIDSITYVDENGVVQTLDPSGYQVDAYAAPARIVPAYANSWPSTRRQVNAVIVTFTAGYAASITADAVANTITARSFGKPWAAGQVVRFYNSGGALPAPLAAKTDYFVISPSGSVFQVSATSGGAAIDLTTTGTGNSFAGEVPESIRQWMLLRIGSLHENREDVVIDTRITAAVLPSSIAAGLLDPERVYWYS